jgi:hypothetical protein
VSLDVQLAEIGDAIQHLRVQMVTLVELLSALVEAEDRSERVRRTNVGAPRIMHLNDDTAITRQPVDERGHLVTVTNSAGYVVDQAFQFTSGDWHSVGLNESGDLMIQEQRDAVHTR